MIFLGQPEKNDPSHPDYVPSIFVYTTNQTSKFLKKKIDKHIRQGKEKLAMRIKRTGKR